VEVLKGVRDGVPEHLPELVRHKKERGASERMPPPNTQTRDDIEVSAALHESPGRWQARTPTAMDVDKPGPSTLQQEEEEESDSDNDQLMDDQTSPMPSASEQQVLDALSHLAHTLSSTQAPSVTVNGDPGSTPQTVFPPSLTMRTGPPSPTMDDQEDGGEYVDHADHASTTPGRRPRHCKKCGSVDCRGRFRRHFCGNVCQDCGKKECEGREGQLDVTCQTMQAREVQAQISALGRGQAQGQAQGQGQGQAQGAADGMVRQPEVAAPNHNTQAAGLAPPPAASSSLET
jgi:hypothetical protein